MTPSAIRAAITASPTLLALARAVPADTAGIAAALSVGKTKRSPDLLDIGDSLELLDDLPSGGGVVLDALATLAATDRILFWLLESLKQGRLRIGAPATRKRLTAAAAADPTLQDAVNLLLARGRIPDVIAEFEVRQAIFADNGDLRV